MILRIALPTPLFKLFDYRLPKHVSVPPCNGCRVLVPFGTRQWWAYWLSAEKRLTSPLES
ncbi:MAG: hypothetical protein LRY63_01235 [Nitrincola sp.]|nr:hypothetical protein [Nitrincola sp.]